MTRIERDTKAVKIILFGENYDKVLDTLPISEAMAIETTISESLHKFYSDVGVNYYDNVDKLPEELVVEVSKNVIDEVKDHSKIQSLTEFVSTMADNIRKKLNKDLTMESIDSLINISLISQSLYEMFGSQEYVEDILKEYITTMLKYNVI